MKPREFTVDEVRQQFLNHCRDLVTYWQQSVASGRSTTDAAISGVVFSLLVTLDGGSVAVPGFKVIPSTHESDQAYLESRGENWYRQSPDDDMDVAGALHELFAVQKSKAVTP